MKPLVHPAAEDITVEGILHALADPVRMHIFAEIAAAGGPLTCSPFLEVAMRPIPKSTLSQHFRVLREAGLIRSERSGVELRNTSRHAELDQRFPGLLDAVQAAFSVQRGGPAGSRRRRRA